MACRFQHDIVAWGSRSRDGRGVDGQLAFSLQFVITLSTGNVRSVNELYRFFIAISGPYSYIGHI